MSLSEGAASVEVVVPSELPVVTPRLARALLAILTAPDVDDVCAPDEDTPTRRGEAHR
jgi:hypothetical protein